MTEDKRPAFGSRHLSSEQDVFSHNAWDDVEWTDEQSEQANAIIDKQYANRMSDSKSGLSKKKQTKNDSEDRKTNCCFFRLSRKCQNRISISMESFL